MGDPITYPRVDEADRTIVIRICHDVKGVIDQYDCVTIIYIYIYIYIRIYVYIHMYIMLHIYIYIHIRVIFNYQLNIFI